MTSVIVRPTERRRGAHSERGLPISVSTTGVAISRPARSPIHHTPHVEATFAAGMTAAARRASVATLAPTTLLAAQQARKAAMSGGIVSVTGRGTKRRTSAAPAAACSVAALASASDSMSAVVASWRPREASSANCTASEPSATPPSMRQP